MYSSPFGVLAEAGDVQRPRLGQVDQLARLGGLAVLAEPDAPDPAGIEVAVDIDAVQLGQGLAPVDIAARDALAEVLALRVVRLGPWGYSAIGGLIFADLLTFARGLNGWKPSRTLQP